MKKLELQEMNTIAGGDMVTCFALGFLISGAIASGQAWAAIGGVIAARSAGCY